MTSTYATGRFTAAAIRSRPRSNAELTSQLLLGEPVLLLEEGREFSRVQCCDDDFEGYVRSDQLLKVDEATYRRQRDNPAFALELYTSMLSDRFGLPVTFGARLPDYDGLRLRHGNQRFSYSGQAALSEDLRTDADLIIRLARKWLFSPELTGGRTPTGIDAASLIQLVARLINFKLPRTAEAMSHHGRTVDFVVQCQPADLAFFDDAKGKITHVGLMLPGSQVLHVNDRVRIDAIDHYGIFNYEVGRYTHRLRIVKRLLADSEQPNVLLKKTPESPEMDERQLAIF